MEPLISVIVPVFCVEKFLGKCVKSIQSQSYQKLEIILVDDGSPDDCPAICDELALEDERIKVIHKKNGGLSDARNAGMKIANGEYFCFVDSDDFIMPTMLEHLVDALFASQARMAIANFRTSDELGMRIFEKQESPIRDGVFQAQELLPKLYQGMGWYYIVAWNKLYHRSLFENIQFPLGKIHEDEYIVTQIMWKAQKIACVSSEEYDYTYLRKGSIMSSRQVQSQCDWLEALYLRFQFCNNIEQLKDFAKETRAVYFRELTNLFMEEARKGDITKKQRKIAMKQYGRMNGKTGTEKVNWFLFQISPALDAAFVNYIRRHRR